MRRHVAAALKHLSKPLSNLLSKLLQCHNFASAGSRPLGVGVVKSVQIITIVALYDINTKQSAHATVAIPSIGIIHTIWQQSTSPLSFVDCLKRRHITLFVFVKGHDQSVSMFATFDHSTALLYFVPKYSIEHSNYLDKSHLTFY